ncbi:MAG: nickel/cobalt exporter [Planctomycetota bacterium]
MISEGLALITVGFTLGLVHALDADHVMAVSALGNTRPGIWRMLRFSANWALGHGGVIVVSGVLLFAFGVGIPAAMVQVAEIMVGLFLIGMGLLCFYRFRRESIRLSEHRHGSVVHRHWHVEDESSHQQNSVADRKRGHAPVMVGIMHGFAGSAPALALVPVVAQGNIWSALGYLLLFSLGVTLAMLAFGLGFGATQQLLQQRFVALFNYFRHSIAGASILVGGYWLSQAL